MKNKNDNLPGHVSFRQHLKDIQLKFKLKVFHLAEQFDLRIKFLQIIL
jgi:hypothetical protein